MSDHTLRQLERQAHLGDTEALEQLIREGERAGKWLGCPFGVHDVDASTPYQVREGPLASPAFWAVYCDECNVWVPVHWTQRRFWAPWHGYSLGASYTFRVGDHVQRSDGQYTIVSVTPSTALTLS